LLYREYEYFPGFEIINYKNGVIVDAGAHVGLYSLLASTFAKKLLSIEPDPFNYKMLVFNITYNNKQNIIYPIHAALWHEKRTVTLQRGQCSTLHSITSNIADMPQYNKSFKVSTITLGEIIEINGEIDLLKMDIEGAEFNVLSNLQANVANSINRIVAEIHITSGNLALLIKKLLLLGFRVYTFKPPIIKEAMEINVEVQGLHKLKMVTVLSKNISRLFNIHSEGLRILFAEREKV